MTATQVDQQRAQAFGERMLGLVNNAFTGIGLSVGNQTGLFDTMASMPPATSEEIARAAGLNERYVREWLNSMVVAHVVEYEAGSGQYSLPPEHAAFLTTDAGPDNMAHMAQFISLLAEVETDVVECFRNGGGVSYDRYPRFAQIMRSDSAAVFDAFLIDTVLPLAPGLPEQLRAGVDVADVGCGAGHAINLMAREYPKSRFTGFDFSSEAIAIAKGEAREWGLTNASFEVQDVAALDVAEEFDVVTAFDAIHDQAHPRRVLAAVHRALKPGGTFLMCDTTGSSHVERNMELPLGPFMYTVSYLHCMTVSLAYDGDGLGTVWGEELAQDLLGEAGFGSVEVNRVEGDLFNNYYLAKKVAKT